MTARNSGIQGGAFIQRQRFKNPKEEGKFLNEQDMMIGEVVQLGVYAFQLVRMDDYTHQYMLDHP
jgi:hypothetical protein